MSTYGYYNKFELIMVRTFFISPLLGTISFSVWQSVPIALSISLLGISIPIVFFIKDKSSYYEFDRKRKKMAIEYGYFECQTTLIVNRSLAFKYVEVSIIVNESKLTFVDRFLNKEKINIKVGDLVKIYYNKDDPSLFAIVASDTI